VLKLERAEIETTADRFVLYFKPTVLAQYRAESHKYALKISDFEGKVELDSTHWEQLRDNQSDAERVSIRFGFRRHKSGEYFLAVFAPDFQEYSQGHVNRWRPYLVDATEMSPLPDMRFESWAMRHLLGSWEIENNVLDRLWERVRLINSLSREAFGTSLFASETNPSLHAPIAENTHAYEDSHREAYGLLVDGLNATAVTGLVARTNVTTDKIDKYTVQRLKRGFPAAKTLWSSLDTVSDERRKAAHSVRPPAKSFAAFETFCSDLEKVVTGLGELQLAMEQLLGAGGEDAMKRQDTISRIPESEGPAHPASDIVASRLGQLAGMTVEAVILSQRKNYEGCHRSELIEFRFTDGSAAYIEAHTNACNVSSVHGDFNPQEFNVSLYTHIVPPRTTT